MTLAQAPLLLLAGLLLTAAHAQVPASLTGTITGAGTFTKPWIMPSAWDLAPAEDVMEYVCENDRDAGHYRN